MTGTDSRHGGAWGERMVCRQLGHAAGRWTLREEQPKYAPDRTCDVEHLRLDLEIDLPRRHVDATCAQRLRAAYGPFDSIVLDAVDLKIRSVRDGNGQDLPHSYLDRKLTIRFPVPVADTIELVVSYEVDHPALGLYFIAPADQDPAGAWQLWSQGEDEEARYWIPCHDAPNERMTTEIVATVESRYTAISNGGLLSVTERDGRKTYHWSEGVPHVSYLIALVVGEFVRLEDRWRKIPVDSYVEKGREEEARRSFGKTPRMIEFFSDRLDCPYPYEKYSQIAIRDFHFGGMENTSATSQSDGTLHDARASLDFTSDDLVSHELAHQWFGDLITCKSWAHAWLNEGFATYLEALWMEEDLGREEFDYEILQFAAAYMAEPYRRAIVSNRYAYPSDLFDMHLYPKAGWVLHMLRRRLGDAIFWKAIRLYVKRHANGCVETIDLIRAFEDASGKNLASFFDQWIMSPGHAEIEGSIAWEENEKRIRASLKQVQKTDGGAPIFAVPIRIECLVEDGSLRAETFEMTAQEQSFYLRVEGKPVTVALDPELAVLATWKVTRPAEWPEASLVGPRRDGRVGARVHAVRQLAERPSYKDESVLGRVLMEDPFWGVQAEAARALAAARSPHALEILLGAVDLPHPKARRAVVEALGDFRAASAAEALAAIVRKGDASYFVEAAAASALGRTRHPGAAPVLRAAMRRQSWHDILALHAARGLAAAREEEAVDDILSLASDRRRYWSCRVGAMSALADLGAARPLLAPRIAEELSRFLEDRSYLVFTRVTNALVSLGHDSGIAALRRAAAATTDPRLVNHYLMAADDLAGQKKRGEDVERLRGDMEKLQGEAKEMREKIERLEERSKGLPATPSPDKTPGRARKRASTRPSAGKGRPSGLRKREGRS